jgi:hypothetical protein
MLQFTQQSGPFSHNWIFIIETRFTFDCLPYHAVARCTSLGRWQLITITNFQYTQNKFVSMEMQNLWIMIPRGEKEIVCTWWTPILFHVDSKADWNVIERLCINNWWLCCWSWFWSSHWQIHSINYKGSIGTLMGTFPFIAIAYRIVEASGKMCGSVKTTSLMLRSQPCNVAE